MRGDWSSDVCSSDLFPSHDIVNVVEQGEKNEKIIDNRNKEDK